MKGHQNGITKKSTCRYKDSTRYLVTENFIKGCPQTWKYITVLHNDEEDFYIYNKKICKIDSTLQHLTDSQSLGAANVETSRADNSRKWYKFCVAHEKTRSLRVYEPGRHCVFDKTTRRLHEMSADTNKDGDIYQFVGEQSIFHYMKPYSNDAMASQGTVFTIGDGSVQMENLKENLLKYMPIEEVEKMNMHLQTIRTRTISGTPRQDMYRKVVVHEFIVYIPRDSVNVSLYVIPNRIRKTSPIFQVPRTNETSQYLEDDYKTLKGNVSSRAIIGDYLFSPNKRLMMTCFYRNANDIKNIPQSELSQIPSIRLIDAIIKLLQKHELLEQNNINYTGITRDSMLCTFVSQESIFFQNTPCMDFNVIISQSDNRHVIDPAKEFNYKLGLEYVVNVDEPVEYSILHLLLPLVIGIYTNSKSDGYMQSDVEDMCSDLSIFFSQKTSELTPKKIQTTGHTYEKLIHQIRFFSETYNSLYTTTKVNSSSIVNDILQHIRNKRMLVWNRVRSRYTKMTKSSLMCGGVFHRTLYNEILHDTTVNLYRRAIKFMPDASLQDIKQYVKPHTYNPNLYPQVNIKSERMHNQERATEIPQPKLANESYYASCTLGYTVQNILQTLQKHEMATKGSGNLLYVRCNDICSKLSDTTDRSYISTVVKLLQIEFLAGIQEDYMYKSINQKLQERYPETKLFLSHAPILYDTTTNDIIKNLTDDFSVGEYQYMKQAMRLL